MELNNFERVYLIDLLNCKRFELEKLGLKTGIVDGLLDKIKGKEVETPVPDNSNLSAYDQLKKALNSITTKQRNEFFKSAAENGAKMVQENIERQLERNKQDIQMNLYYPWKI